MNWRYKIATSRKPFYCLCRCLLYLLVSLLLIFAPMRGGKGTWVYVLGAFAFIYAIYSLVQAILNYRKSKLALFDAKP